MYHTYSEWVWVPTVSWSPDGRLLVATVHGVQPNTAPEDSPVFDLWAVRTDSDPAGEGPAQVRRGHVGHAGVVAAWGALFSPIAYGQAREPGNSQNSLYDLYVMDSDGSNARAAFKAGRQRPARAAGHVGA